MEFIQVKIRAGFILFLAFATLLISSDLFAAPDLQGGNAATGPGQEVNIPINFVADGSVVALQFDLDFDPAVFSPQQVGAGTALAGHTLDWQELQPGTLRFVITTASQQLLSSGNLADLRLLAAANAQAQTYPLQISNVVLADAAAQPVTASSIVDGSITISLINPISVPTLSPLALMLMVLLIAGIFWVFYRRGLAGVSFSVFLGLMLFSSTITRAAPLPGDANNDGMVNAGDIPVIVEQILERATAPGDPDCNVDQQVNVLDTICASTQVANSPPVLAAIGNQTTLVDQLFSLTATATDPDAGAVLTFSLSLAPTGMSINPQSGLISWTPNNTQLGVNDVTVLVVDDKNASDSKSFVVTVTEPQAQNQAPNMIPPGNRVITASDAFTTPLFATDPDIGDVLTFSLVSAPVGMNLDSASGMLSWTPVAGDLGMHSISARVIDTGGLLDTEVFNVEVVQSQVSGSSNAAPVLSVPLDQELVFDTLLSVQASATDADVGDTLTFEFVNAPAGMTIDPVSGAINWTPTEPQIGVHDVAVRVSDTAAAVDVGSFIVVVSNINRSPVAVDDTYTARIGETLVVAAPGVLENDIDPDGDALSAVLQSTTANGNLVFNADGSFEYTPEVQQDDFEFGAQMICQPAERRGVEAVPLVIDLDGDGLSEIVFTGGYQTSGASKHHITAMRPDCTILWSYESDGFATPIPNVGTTTYHRQPITAADMDGDGDIEIFILIESDISIERVNRYAILDHQGTMIGKTDIIPQIANPFQLQSTGPAIADLDGDGNAEFIVAFIQSNKPYLAIFDHTGALLVVNEDAPQTANTSNSLGTKPVIIDLDGDAIPEILMTSHVYSNTGAYLRTFPLYESLGATTTVRHNPRAIPAVANFDLDPEPEVYFQTNRGIYLFDADGSLIWFFDDAARKDTITSAALDQPTTIADVDGDGEVEIVTYINQRNLTVIEADGSIKWQDAITWEWRDIGPTAFDIDADGIAEVIHQNNIQGGDQTTSGLYTYDGKTGQELSFTQLDNGSSHGHLAMVVDLDDDGESEIIVNNAFPVNGVFLVNIAILKGLDNNPWAASRGVHNQLIDTYTHIENDGSVPVSVKPHWLQPGKNGFNFVPQVNKVFTEVQCEINISEGGNYQHNGTVAVGDVDNDGDLEMVGVGGVTPFTFMATLWIASATDCSQELNESPAIVAGGGISSGSHPGLLDIDGDGDLEIITTRGRLPAAEGGAFDLQHLMAIHHDGTLAWPGNGGSADSIVLGTGDAGQGWRYSGPTFADIDGDGSVEIIMATRISVIGGFQRVITVFNSIDGSLKWEYRGQIMASATQYLPPTVVDLDMDGSMEIIISADVVSHLGVLEFRLPFESPYPTDPRYTTFLYTAVANFDNDPYPEIVARDIYNRYLFNHDGSLVWKVAIRNQAVGQITVADFDGDNEVEFAYMTTQESGFGGFPGYITMYDTDGSVLWTHKDIPELYLNSNSRTGQSPNPTAFDANGDGAADIVIHYNNGHPPDDAGIYFFNGRDGSILEYIGFGSYHTSQRFLTIADTDNDGEAELISSFSSGLSGSTTVWQGTSAHPLPPAPAHHNQWVTNEAYADAKGNVLSNPTPHWLQPGLNGWNLIKMPPHPLAGTVDSFTYLAGDGVFNSNIASVSFDVQPAGTPPAFLSEPDTLTTVGFPYEYAPRVVDTDPGDSVSFVLTAAPAGMSIDPASGKVTYAPDTEGSFAVNILASDTIGFSTLQSYTLIVGLPVSVPDVIAQPEAAAESTLISANLLIGDKQNRNHPTIPVGAVSSQFPVGGSVAEFGSAVDLVISLGPAPEDIDNDVDGFTENQGDCNDNDNTIHPGANDPPGDGIDQDCDGIDGNLTIASILVLPATEIILTNEVINLTATAIFVDGTSQNLTEIVSWSAGPAFSSATSGVFTVTANRGAVSGSATITVVGRVPGDITPPVVEITSPNSGDKVNDPIDIIGTAEDSNFLKYTLGLKRADELSYTEIAVSTSQVSNDVLGVLDPTTLVNGIYALKLTGTDSGGNMSVAETEVSVEGGAKPGLFSLTFTDLSIPLGGMPIQISRTYDSRDKTRGDFGIGWNMSIKNFSVSCTDLGANWFVSKAGLSYALLPEKSHSCSVRLPNGRVERFEFQPSPAVSVIIPFSFLGGQFTPFPGTLGKLKSLDNTNWQAQNLWSTHAVRVSGC